MDHFLHHTPKLGVPVEMVRFLLKLLLKQISSCAPRFPLILTASRIFYLRLRNPDYNPTTPSGTRIKQM